jgi:carbon starvation protein
MDALLLMVVCFGGYILAYHTYGRFLAKKIFKLRPNAMVPSHAQNDGVDFVPTKKGIIFGHHFTSIAGTGPIVGPAIGVIWGWLPALLWVFFGSIFMGAVHDLGSLVVSLRNDGKSISEIAARYINKRVRLIFFIIVFFSLLIIIAIFGIVIATVFKLYPESVIAVWLEVPIALVLGYAIYKKSANVKLATAVAVFVCQRSLRSLARAHKTRTDEFSSRLHHSANGNVDDHPVDLCLGRFDLAGYHAAATAGLYQRLAIIYYDGPAGCGCSCLGIVRWG